MSEAVDSLGGRLKAERERKGFSAQKAADQLHLDAWIIEALESGDYARIGPAVYGKGHLKRYAGLLGLPPDEIISAYETRQPALVEAAPAPALRMGAAEAPNGASPRVVVAGIAAAMLLVAGAGILWWRPWQQRPAAAKVVAPAPGAALSAPGIGPPPAAGNERGAAAVNSVDGAPAAGRPVDSRPAEVATVAAVADPTDAVGGVGHARLRLSFSADSWVDVRDAAGRRLYAGRGHANSVKSIAGAAPLRVYLGFARGVQLEINNHVVAIGPQFIAGDAAHFEAGADGVLRRDPHASAAGDPRPRG